MPSSTRQWRMRPGVSAAATGTTRAGKKRIATCIAGPSRVRNSRAPFRAPSCGEKRGAAKSSGGSLHSLPCQRFRVPGSAPWAGLHGQAPTVRELLTVPRLRRGKGAACPSAAQEQWSPHLPGAGRTSPRDSTPLEGDRTELPLRGVRCSQAKVEDRVGPVLTRAVPDWLREASEVPARCRRGGAPVEADRTGGTAMRVVRSTRAPRAYPHPRPPLQPRAAPRRHRQCRTDVLRAPLLL